MLKYLAVLVFIGGLAFYIAVQDKHAAEKAAQKSAERDHCTIAREANGDHPQENVSDTKVNSPRWYSVFRWPDGVTTWAIILTLMAIAEQSQATATAARATTRSVELQELAYVQWIDVDNWKTALGTGPHGKPVLRLQFEVKNPTNFPLTISQALRTVMGNIECVVGETFCPPNSPFAVDESVSLTGKQVQDWSQGKLTFPIRGTFSFIGVLKKREVQPLDGTLECGPMRTLFVPSAPINPGQLP